MIPQWDESTRTLYVRITLEEKVIVKRFRVPAEQQIAVLREFQRCGWPRRISDPLPPTHQQSPKLKLNETIKSLNRNQNLIRFHGDGTGEGVWWELARH